MLTGDCRFTNRSRADAIFILSLTESLHRMRGRRAHAGSWGPGRQLDRPTASGRGRFRLLVVLLLLHASACRAPPLCTLAIVGEGLQRVDTGAVLEAPAAAGRPWLPPAGGFMPLSFADARLKHGRQPQGPARPSAARRSAASGSEPAHLKAACTSQGFSTASSPAACSMPSMAWSWCSGSCGCSMLTAAERGRGARVEL